VQQMRYKLTEENTIATLARSEYIGFKAFLALVRVPGFNLYTGCSASTDIVSSFFSFPFLSPTLSLAFAFRSLFLSILTSLYTSTYPSLSFSSPQIRVDDLGHPISVFLMQGQEAAFHKAPEKRRFFVPEKVSFPPL